MKKRLVQMMCALVIGAMALTGCGSSTTAGETDGKIVRLVSGGEPGSLHPALAQGTHESIILDHIFEGLMKRDEASNIVPGMAESYEVSEDGYTYTFTLRDANWSNGDPVTAHDFEYSWKHVLNPETASEYAYQLYYLKNGQAYNEGTGSADEVGVKALDDKTLEVTLEAPTAYFLELCAFYTYYPVNQKIQEENPDWSNSGDAYVCNGPFKLVEWNHDSNVELVKNENYYSQETIKLDGIDFLISEDQNTIWQMYDAGEIDVNYDLPTDVLDGLIQEGNAELTTAPELATYFYRFNTTKAPFNNVKVRKALSMAIDRQTLIDTVVLGKQISAYGVVPPEVTSEAGDFREVGGDYFEENIEEAKKLLAEGLQEEGVTDFTFTILYNTSEGHKKIAEAIQQMWKQNLGIDVQLENAEFQVKIDRESVLDYDVSRSGWIGDYVDPNTFLDMFTSWSSQNQTGWTSETYDELIQSAITELDVNTRIGYLHDAEELLMDEMPIMPIYYYTKNFVTKPYLVGVTKPVNREVNLIYADIVNE